MTRYITFRETQAKLGWRGRTTIYRDIDNKRIPRPVKIGGRLYWAEAELDAAIAALASK
jgi:prophage regulatory protein